MIADFMTYRGIAMMVARLIDARNWPLLLGAAVQSITQDYSWAAALAPGFLLALTEPTSRAIYTFALLALYATPAALALAILAARLRWPGGGVRATRGRPLSSLSASPPCSSLTLQLSRSLLEACLTSAVSCYLSARSGWRNVSAGCSHCRRVMLRKLGR